MILAASICVALAEPLPIDAAAAKDFIPQRKHVPLPATVIGVLVPDGQAVLANEGRSGPGNQICFAANGASYRWVCVQVDRNPGIGTLNLPIGDGTKTRKFERLSIATPTTLKSHGVPFGFALVEVEVNEGLGSPAVDSFVATRFKRLDGTDRFPLVVADVIADIRRRYDAHRKELQRSVDESMNQAATKHLGDRKLTGPRETEEVMFVTWQNANDSLRVLFRSRTTDGDYQYANGIKIELGMPPVNPGSSVLPHGLRYGKQISAECGIVYEVSKSGRVERTIELPISSSMKELPPPPVFKGRPAKGK
jgi:hypothetical protein